MIGLLSKEQVDNLTYKECKAALKLLNKSHRMDTPWKDLTKEEKDMSDDVGNTLLWLEDRIRLFDDPRIPSMDPNALVIVKKEPAVKSKRPPRKFMISGVLYESARDASLKTGIKLGTLQTYVRRKPDIYQYVD